MTSGNARAVLLASAAALLLDAAPARAAERRPRHLPDHAKLQLAGNVGFLSPGAGWRFGRRTETDVLFGWVPEAVGGTDIFSLTGKITFAPWVLSKGPYRIRPLTLGAQLTYTFGSQYFVVPPFTFTPTALRSGVAFGVAAERPWRGRTLGLYAETVVLDLGLAHWIGNRREIGPTDVFSLAVGARLAF